MAYVLQLWAGGETTKGDREVSKGYSHVDFNDDDGRYRIIVLIFRGKQLAQRERKKKEKTL